MKNDLSIVNPLIRRQVLQGLAWREDLGITEDFHLGFALLDRGATWFQTVEPLYVYYTGCGVTSRQRADIVRAATAAVEALAGEERFDVELRSALLLRAQRSQRFSEVCELGIPKTGIMVWVCSAGCT